MLKLIYKIPTNATVKTYSVISGGDPLQGAAQGLVVYLANHLGKHSSIKKVNLYYSNESSEYTNEDIETGGIGKGIKNIMKKNGIKLNIINSPDCNEDVSKNDVTLRFITSKNNSFDGNSPLSPDNKSLEYEVNYVRTNNNFGQGTKSMKEIAYNAAHEIAHQLYNKAQIYFYGIVKDFGNDGYGHFDKYPNLLNSGKGGVGSAYLLPSTCNFIHNFLK